MSNGIQGGICLEQFSLAKTEQKQFLTNDKLCYKGSMEAGILGTKFCSGVGKESMNFLVQTEITFNDRNSLIRDSNDVKIPY